MDEMLELLSAISGEAQSAGKLGALAVATIVAKYSTDVLRARVVQRALAWVEKMAGMRAGLLQWSAWSDRTRVLITLAKSFAIGLLAALAAGAQWGSAIGAGIMAAVGAKGLHDTGVMPGRRPSKRGPATVVDRRPRASSDLSRDLGLRTAPPVPKWPDEGGPDASL